MIARERLSPTTQRALDAVLTELASRIPKAETPEKEKLELYALLLPGLAQWTQSMRERDVTPNTFVAAAIGAAASVVAHAVRNATCDSHEEKLKVAGPVAAAFVRDFSCDLMAGAIVAIDAEGRLDS